MEHIPGIKRLVAQMTHPKRNGSCDWRLFLSPSGRHILLPGKTVAEALAEFPVGGKRGDDILLKGGLQVETKSWWRGWAELPGGIKKKRLNELRDQVTNYLHADGSRLLLEFEKSIPADVLSVLEEFAGVGTRLTWQVIPL